MSSLIRTDLSLLPDWRSAAWENLRNKRDRLLEVLSGMQSDYITVGSMDNAALCMQVKQGLKDITTHAPIKAVADNPAGTLQAFEAAVVQRWTELADPAPIAVKAEFYRYATEF